MPIPTAAFATDEDLCLRLGEDFARVAPLDQAVASGNDGAFGPGDRWTLTSPSVPSFAAQGGLPGMVALVSPPRRGLGPELQALAVDSVAAGVTLRRKGLAPGAGQPPAPVGGASGVQFTVVTMTPQLLRATYEIDRRLGIDDLVPGRRVADLYDADELRDATLLTVLWKLYEASAREGSGEAKEGAAAAMWAKARAIKAELDEVLARLSVHWNTLAARHGAAAPPSTRFGTRISR
jgi:hypothetical protein